jgi:hypothetical protein
VATHPFTKEFDTYEDATRWLYERDLPTGILEEMWPSGWLLTLEGEAAQKARTAERPLAAGGVHLIENSEYVVQS